MNFESERVLTGDIILRVHRGEKVERLDSALRDRADGYPGIVIPFRAVVGRDREDRRQHRPPDEETWDRITVSTFACR